MKSKLFIITLLCFSKSLIAQDTLRVETVVDSSFKTPQYVAAYDDVFLSHQETKWLVKVDFMGLLLNKELKLNSQSFLLNTPIRNATNYSSGIQTASLSFERKLTTNLSINAQIASTQNFLDREVPFIDMPLTLMVEPRFYFRKKEEIKKGASGNNLNGSYVSFAVIFETNSKAFERDYHTYLNPSVYSNKLMGAINYGFQKRIFNRWYFDYKLGLGIHKATQSIWFSTTNQQFNSAIVTKNLWKAQLINNFSLGLALGKGKRKNVNFCDFFRCFEEEKSLWKLDIRQILKAENYFISSNLNIGYEQKINKSAWSLNALLNTNILFRSIPRERDYGFSMAIEPRFYYNLKKNISKGASVNNLSGCYVSLELGSGLNYEHYYPFFWNSSDWTIKSQNNWIIPKWGIQKRIFKYGFADFSLAPIRYNVVFKNIKENDIQTKNTQNSWQYSTIGKIPVPIADFKIGFAF